MPIDVALNYICAHFDREKLLAGKEMIPIMYLMFLSYLFCTHRAPVSDSSLSHAMFEERAGRNVT